MAGHDMTPLTDMVRHDTTQLACVGGTVCMRVRVRVVSVYVT